MDSKIISNTVNKFKEIIPQYEKLGLNLKQALELLLEENDIPYLSVSYRVKEITSFNEKIERKKYKKPLEEIEDLCGIRTICYYQSDIERIKDIVKKEFIVIENENKVESLEFDQFGYRSLHLIIKIKKQWLNTPNYRGLENLKAELQIRTVLMHAWAEIEHKLAYKSESQIPKQFRRKLSRISAKLEESDEQFEDIKNQIQHNKSILIESAKETQTFQANTEFNLDTLQAFLDYAFPERVKDIKATSILFDDMKAKQVTLDELVYGYEKSKPYLLKVENEFKKILSFKEIIDGKYMWLQVGAARFILYLTSDNFNKDEISFMGLDIVKKYRKLIKENNK